MLTSRSVAETRVTSLPPMRISPLVAISRPAISRRVVVFPHPDGPRRVTSVPAATVNETSRTATTDPYVLVTRRNSTEAERFCELTSGCSWSGGSGGSPRDALEAHRGWRASAEVTATDQALDHQHHQDHEHDQDRAIRDRQAV